MKGKTKDDAEPWLRATHSEIAPVERAVLHALELAEEDIARWCEDMDRAALNRRPLGLPSVAFQLRHMARSLNRFVTYANGGGLNGSQQEALASELAPDADPDKLFAELAASLRETREWIYSTLGQPLEKPVSIGRKALPATRGGLLVHMAEHTQRHVGQMITTAKIVAAFAHDS